MKKPVRKINVAAPVKAATGKATPKTISVAKPKNIAKPVQASAPKVRAPKVPRVEHSVVSLYTGASVGLNKRKSGTVLDLKLAGSKPDYILSERSELIGETIKREYGNKPFPRGNLDAGVLKHLLIKGFVEAVSGNGGEDTVLRFTKSGMAHHRKAA